MGMTDNLDAYYKGKPKSFTQVMDRFGAAASDIASEGVNAVKNIGQQAIVNPIVSGAKALSNYQNQISEGAWGSAGTASAAPPPPASPKAAISPPPPPAATASKGATGASNPDNSGMGSAIPRTSQSGLDYAGGLQKAMGEGNSFNDNNLPSGTGQSVTGITPREAPDPNFWRNQQLMDDAMRASTIRYQTLNSISSMIQDIQNRMGNNYGNRMDQAMSPEQGTKAINNLMSGIGNFGSTGREVEGQQAAQNAQAETGAKTAHFNQLAEDSRLNRAIEMGKLQETSRSNQAREAIDTGKYGMEYDLGRQKVAADIYGHDMSYKAGQSKNEAAMNVSVVKDLPKITESVDAEMAQIPKKSIEDNFKRAQATYPDVYGKMTIEDYKAAIRKKKIDDGMAQAQDVYRRNPTDVNMAIISPTVK